MRFIGVDLAWGEGNGGKQPNETGLVVLDDQGVVLDADWVRGVEDAALWVSDRAEPGTLVAVDAPLVITNEGGMRQCEREVGRAYGRWKVSANASNTAMGWQAGVSLRQRLEQEGVTYLDGLTPAPADGRSMIEVYPYTTLVGMWELGYDDERPRYKRLNPSVPAPEARQQRAAACDELLRRVAALAVAETPLDLRSHPLTARLLDEPSPLDQTAYKHREDLLDAALCAWTAAVHHTHPERTQVLGAGAEPDADGRRPVIVAPARPEQRVATKSSQARGGADAGSGSGADATAASGGSAAVDRALASVKELRRDVDGLATRLRALEKELTALRRR